MVYCVARDAYVAIE